MILIHLSKKIAIPNSKNLNCIAWNKNQGFIACGGGDGLLKCLQLDSSPETIPKGKLTSNLTMNQTLEGHSGEVQVITWNETHQKLTSSDQNGLIIVWMLYKGSWHEEMVNNRNKSVVRGMAWDAEGQKICIVYEDGAVIVGSVDGNRLWGKELKSVSPLTGVEWSPDGRLLLFSIKNGEVQVYDSQGSYVMKVVNHCITQMTGSVQVAGMHWFKGGEGYVAPDRPVLAICYRNGFVQLMRNEHDTLPILIDLSMQATCAGWSHDGSMLAISGKCVQPGQTMIGNSIQFFSPYGEHLATLRVPGKGFAYLEWEKNSLRLALATDSYIFFANLRFDYKWSYFDQTLLYTYLDTEHDKRVISFWDTRTNDVYSSFTKEVLSVESYGLHAIIGTIFEDHETSLREYGLIVYNTISTPIETRYIDVKPLHVGMNASHIVAADCNNFLVWHYRVPKDKSSFQFHSTRHRRERMYHIDDTPSGVAEVMEDLDSSYDRSVSTEDSLDPITCMAVSSVVLVIGRKSGTIQRYTLPQVALTNRYRLNFVPYYFAINCNSTRIAIISSSGLLKFLDITSNIAKSDVDHLKSEAVARELNGFERKDVWGIRWAEDNPELIAIMEKNRMYIFKGIEPEEPIACSGYIASFKDLEVCLVLLDDIVQLQSTVKPDFLVRIDIKSLRDTRDLLEKVGIPEATTFIEENPHPRLWRLLAEKALQNLELDTAEAAYVRCSDYPGICFVKQLRAIYSDSVKKAEVAAHLKNFDLAEQIYLQIDRRDLAVALRRRLGHWLAVLKLLEEGVVLSTDKLVKHCSNKYADELAIRHQWDLAREYYEKAENFKGQIRCYKKLNDYEGLAKMADSLPEKHPMLVSIGYELGEIGMCAEAVAALLKANNLKLAIDTCITLNQWDKAVHLAQGENIPTIRNLLAKYADHLLSRNKTLEAVELYRKANKFLEGAELLFKKCDEEKKKNLSYHSIKKLYKLAALLVEDHRNCLDPAFFDDPATQDVTRKTQVEKMLDTAWEGATAYHFFMLALRQLKKGSVDAALRTSLHLQDFDHILPPNDVFMLLALTSAHCKAFGTCSEAFMKLDSLTSITEKDQEELFNLRLEIFSKYRPKNARGVRSKCINCDAMIPESCNPCTSCGTKFSVCALTGRPLMNLGNVWTCTVCKCNANSLDVLLRKSCPICSTAILQNA